MGTINYKTSNFITLAVKPYDFDDIKQGMRDDIIAGDYDGLSLDDIENDDIIYDQINEYYSCDRCNAESIIDRYNLYFFTVSIEYGYYEGLSIDIDFDYVYFDNYREKQDAIKEIAQLKSLLMELAGCGFVSCCPLWITSYKDYSGTIKDINAAMKQARNLLKSIPTCRDYYRRGGHFAAV